MVPNSDPRTLDRRHLSARSLRASRQGLSLFEVTTAVAVIGILAGAMIPLMQADIPDRLQAAGQVVVADLDYARSLAIANNSTYRITTSSTQNSYWLTHAGPSTVLNTLPATPFHERSDTATKQTTALAKLPIAKPGVQLVGALQMSSTPVTITSVDFNSLGGTTRAEETVIWLGCGQGAARRFLSVRIHPTTGLVKIGSLSKQLPAPLVDVTAACLPLNRAGHFCLNTAANSRIGSVA